MSKSKANKRSFLDNPDQYKTKLRLKIYSVLKEMYAYSILSIFLLIFVLNCSPQKFCNFPIGTNWKNTHKWALFHKNDGSLYPAKEHTVIVPFNEEFTLSCGPNYLAYSNYTKKTIKAKCDSNLYKEEPFLTGDLSCDLRPIEVVDSGHETPEACSKIGGKSGLIAYMNPMTKEHMVLGDLCLNDKDGHIIYLNARVQGALPQKIQKWKPLEFDSEYKIDFMKTLKFDQLYQKMKRFIKSDDFPYFEMSSIFDETLLGNQQLMSISKIGANYILIPEGYKLLHLLQSDVADFGKDKHLLAGFRVSKKPFTLHNLSGESMPLYLLDAFEGDQPKFPIPEKLIMTLSEEDGETLYEFILTFDPSEAKSNGNDQCKSIPWLKRVNSAASSMRKLISCSDSKISNFVKKL